MTNYIKRLIYVDAQGKQKITPLVWPFLFATFFYGLGFMSGDVWSGVTTSSLFQAFYAIHNYLPIVWGTCAFLASTFAIILVLFRRFIHLGDFAAL